MNFGNVRSTMMSQSYSASSPQLIRQNFKDLTSGLQSGNLTSSLKAYTSLNSHIVSLNSNSPLAQIGKALQDGDLAGAQKIFQSIQNKNNLGSYIRTAK